MKRFKIYCTHNPQDFFNGDEPAELCKAYFTCDLEADVSKEIEAGYRVIVTKENDHYETKRKQEANSICHASGTL